MPRPGAPDNFTLEQLCQIMALACELPENHSRPIARWTHVELAEETIKQGIVRVSHQVTWDGDLRCLSHTFVRRRINELRNTESYPKASVGPLQQR